MHISKNPAIWLLLAAVITAALLVSCATMFGTDLTPDQAQVVEVIDCPGIDKDRLFVMANSWAVDRFVSAESVIEYSDKEAGIVKGKYVLSYWEALDTYDLRSTLTIEIKDGAARITIADPYYRRTTSLGETLAGQSYYPMKSAASFNKNCLPKYRNLIASFKKAMQETGGEF